MHNPQPYSWGTAISASVDTPAPGEIKDQAAILHKVQTALVEQLFRQTWIGLGGVLVTACMACAALWQALPTWKLIAWCGALLLTTMVRGMITTAFDRTDHAACTAKDILFWARLHFVGTFASGLLWALPPFILWPSHSPVHQLIWPICTVALSASAVTTYCTWKPSYRAFLLLSAVSLAIRLLIEGGMVHTILGILALFFTAVLERAGRGMHDASRNALLMGIRNETLNSYLAEEKVKLEQLTGELQNAHDRLHQVSLTDELTGLWNRRFFNATIPDDVSLAIRSHQDLQNGRQLAIADNIDLLFIMVDLDHFKKVNDTHGHAAGDLVLIQLSQMLVRVCRDSDTVIRWGGEEFMIVAKNVYRQHFGRLAERIRREVALHPFEIGTGPPLSLTCSLGAAVFPFLPARPDLLEWDQIVELTDVCLYAAKRTARNAWIGIAPTALTTPDDLTRDLAGNLPGLIADGKLAMDSNLPPGTVILWKD